MENLFSNDHEESKSIEIDLDKHYKIPENISIIAYAGIYLVVAVDFGNWIVLNNSSQVSAFESLRVHSVAEVLNSKKIAEDDIAYVLTQIEARHFENTMTTPKSAGEGVQLYLTNKCNLRCPHCYMMSGVSLENELSVKEWTDIIHMVAEHGADRITFSGGEATLHPNLAEFVVLSDKLGMRAELLSNGLLITEDFLNKCGYSLSRVQISIDGYSDKSNSIHRGKGHFSYALRAVKLLLDRNITTDIGITPPFSTSLHNQIDDYVAFINEYKDQYANKPLNIALTGSLMDGRDLHLTKEQKDYYTACIDQISVKCFGPHYKEIGFIQFKRLFGIDDCCPYGDLHITANGDIYFCSHLPEMKPLGNVRKLTKEEIYHFADEAKIRANINNIAPCRNCAIKYICGGNCRIDHIPEFLDCSKLPAAPNRKCTLEDKSEIYQLMIETNEYLYQ